MAGWHQRCNEHELGQTPRDDEGQGGLAGCSPWGSQRVGHNWAAEQQEEIGEKGGTEMGMGLRV